MYVYIYLQKNCLLSDFNKVFMTNTEKFKVTVKF